MSKGRKSFHKRPNPYVMNPERFNDCNFPTPFLETPNALVIPTPVTTPLGISSVWRPFDNPVTKKRELDYISGK